MDCHQLPVLVGKFSCATHPVAGRLWKDTRWWRVAEFCPSVILFLVRFREGDGFLGLGVSEVLCVFQRLLLWLGDYFCRHWVLPEALHLFGGGDLGQRHAALALLPVDLRLLTQVETVNGRAVGGRRLLRLSHLILQDLRRQRPRISGQTLSPRGEPPWGLLQPPAGL